MKNIILFLAILLLLSACGRSGKGIKMTNYVKMEINSKEISQEDIEELRELFLNLEPATYEFYEKPEVIAFGYRTDNDKRPDMFSIFIAEGFIYAGDYFIAWADRMKGRTSKCYKLDEYTSYLLENYK